MPLDVEPARRLYRRRALSVLFAEPATNEQCGLAFGERVRDEGENAKLVTPGPDPAPGRQPFRVERGSRSRQPDPAASVRRERTQALRATSVPVDPRRRGLHAFGPGRKWLRDRLEAPALPTAAPLR